MSGLNHNMNHIVKRIETRVLQPPGGASSFSIGGYGGSDSYSNHNSKRSNYSNSQSRQAAPQAPVSNKGHAGSVRRDSLDDLVQCNIPGLEGHYQSRPQPTSGSMLAAVGVQSSNVKQSTKDYAAQLKAQIDLKASMKKDEFENPYSRNNRTFDNKENGYSDSRRSAPSSREFFEGSSSKRNSYASAASNEYGSGPHTSTKIRAPPGGQTTFSIGWN